MPQMNQRVKPSRAVAADALAPPPWAARSVVDDGGIVHELVSSVQPAARFLGPAGWLSAPTQVSLSAVDQRVGDTWVRSGPTVQLEGGSYSVEDVRRLCAAVEDLLDCMGKENSAS